MDAERGHSSALVAGTGIGRGIVEMFAGAGTAVVVSDLNQEAADAVALSITAVARPAVGVACDVTKEAALQAVVDRFGGLTILVNNAGGGGPKLFDMPMQDFRWACELNVFSVFRL